MLPGWPPLFFWWYEFGFNKKRGYKNNRTTFGGGGQEASFDINIINNNNVGLNSASLLVEYPTSTRSAIDLSKELNKERFALGTIKSGESYNQNIKAVFFGEKDSLKQLKISLEYRVENSSALFIRKKHMIYLSVRLLL